MSVKQSSILFECTAIPRRGPEIHLEVTCRNHVNAAVCSGFNLNDTITCPSKRDTQWHLVTLPRIDNKKPESTLKVHDDQFTRQRPLVTTGETYGRRSRFEP